MEATSAVPAAATAASSSPAASAGPLITIISSDGESFSLSANTVVHSHLLEGAVRRWAEVYQAHATPLRTGSNRHQANRAGSLPAAGEDDDATTTDVTADDLEETPDEGFIEQFYDETASDLTAASGVVEDGLNNSISGPAVGAGPAGASSPLEEEEEADRPKVMRMVSVPVNDEEVDDAAAEALQRGEDGVRTPPFGEACDDGEDSDRTASVLPSSHEGSVSSSTTPTKATGTSGDMTSSSPTSSLSGGALRSASPMPRDINTPTSAAASGGKSLAAAAAAGVRGSGMLSNGSLTTVPLSLTLTGDVADLSAFAKSTLPMRSPGNAISSPMSRGSHPSPSTLMDADQSTPSVLSEQEEEVVDAEAGSGEAGGTAKTRAKADPRNLGDEGLEDDAAAAVDGNAVDGDAKRSSKASCTEEGKEEEVLSNGGASPSSQSPSPEAVAGSPPLLTRHTDPLASSPKSTTDAISQESTQPLSPSARTRFNERRHTAVVIQAGAAEEDVEDGPMGSAGNNLSTSSSSPRSGGGGQQSASPPPDWRSPGSCHQRTPCIADEDDVGAMVGDDENEEEMEESFGKRANANASADSPHNAIVKAGQHASALNGTAWSASATSDATAASAGVRGEDLLTSGKPGLAVDTSTPAADVSCETASPDLASTVVYGDSIRITSSAIVVDLLSVHSPRTASSTPMVSPQSLREGTASMELAAGAGSGEQELRSPSSAGGTVAGCDEASADGHAEALTSATSATIEDAAAGPKISIHSSILTLCIKYMTHFAEAEAQAAAEASEKNKKHKHGHHRHRHHHHHRRTSSNSTGSTASSSASSSNDSDSSDSETTSVSSSASTTSISPSVGAGGHSLLDLSGRAAGTNATAMAAATDAKRGANIGQLGGPACIPVPLASPLITGLSEWERTFLYLDVLGAPQTVLTAAMAIQEICPDFDYGCPGPYLSKPRVKVALMTPPPPPEGVHTLMDVMAAAKQLQMDSLHALCAGWLADFMIRVSYGATDNFEAAHLIRQCLRVPSHWNRRETDCLKLENEWPANEDAE